jgi:hypothetical protein
MDPVSGAILCAAIAGLCSILVAFIARADRKKVAETHRQLTTNHHVSSPPTSLDKLDSIQAGLEELHRRQDGTDLMLMDVKETLSRHIEWHMEKK